ncbi:TerL [Gordonia phage GordDuk1]|uniref:TerL n=1 Tax=Gordonia phage GordDuk1 TaxID=1622191 RepID=A0A0E3T811_9CAUD|nr:TerL [Gordonia phage GordDuk1]AKC02930.1 TerL [Gordonia phage GordDuk1]
MAQQFNPQTVKKAAVANSTGRKRGPKTAPTLPVNNNWGGMTSLAQRIEWLKNNPAFDEVPATMEEFLGPRYLDIDPTQNSGLQKGVGIRPGVKKALIDIFGKGVDPNSISLIKRGMFTGGIGVGKSTLASIALTYMVHWVSCLHDPQGYFGLLPGSRIAFMMMSTRASHAQEVLFGDIKARINSCEWFKKNCPHDEKLTKQLRFPKDIWIIPGTSQETSVEGYNVLCQDDKATALTKRGWLRYDQINDDDELLTLDHNTGLAEWNKIQRMNVFNVDNASVKRMENNEFSSITSLNHKWPVLRRVQRDKKRMKVRTWTNSIGMKGEDSIPISAVNSDRPEVGKYSDALVEAVAWYYTEGWVRDSLSGIIYQNLNSEGYGRIKQCMTELFGPSVDNIEDHDSLCWRETLNTSGGRELSEFRFSRGAGRVLAEHAPGKIPSHEFLLSLTQSQLEMFINVSMLADNRGPCIFSQKNHAASEAFAFAAILSGRSVSIKKQWQPCGNNGYWMLNVRLMKKTSVSPVHAARYGGTNVTERYTGVLWCPTVKNSSFLTRREGNVYFTGNCGIIDEGDSHKVTQEKDYAEEAWNTIHGRIASRFTDPVIQDHRGLLLAIGQMKKANGFMAKKKHDLLTDGKPNQLVVEMTIWDSLGWDRFMKGNKRDSFFFDIVRKKQATPAQAYGAGKNIIEIPNAYFKDFDNDPIRALKDHAGIPPAVEDPFITLIDRVDDAQDKWAERFKDKYKYTVDSSCTMPQFHPDFEADSILKRAVHVDIAFAPGGDAMGMAMGHIPELVEIDGELKPRIVFDFLLRMKPSGGDALQLADFRKILYHLRDDLKFKIGVVTFDGFNSMDSIQILRKKHFNVGEMSVDRTKAPYEELREAIYERRIEFPKYMTYLTRADTDKVNIARLELSELQDTGRKIDHPPKGSKDIADAMAGVVYDLMSNVSFRRGSKRDITEQRIAEDEMEYNSKVLGDSFSLSQDEFAELSDLLSAEPGNPRNPISTGRPGYGLPPIEKDPFGLAGLNMP